MYDCPDTKPRVVVQIFAYLFVFVIEVELFFSRCTYQHVSTSVIKIFSEKPTLAPQCFIAMIHCLI